MSINQQDVLNTLAFDPEQLEQLRHRWSALMEQSVWGELQLSKIGALPRLRKRILELGEVLASLFADRSWIPQPREQLKNALGTSVKLRDALLALERSAVLINGGAGRETFEAELLEFRQQLLQLLEKHEAQWAALLETQYEEQDDE